MQPGVHPPGRDHNIQIQHNNKRIQPVELILRLHANFPLTDPQANPLKIIPVIILFPARQNDHVKLHWSLF